MSNIFQKYAAVRAKYPDDIARIETEEEQVRATLSLQAFSEQPVTQQLLTLCRSQVIELRRKLATDRSLVGETEAQRDIWSIIDARMWFIQLVGKDFEGELALIEESLETELAR